MLRLREWRHRRLVEVLESRRPEPAPISLE